MRDKCGGYLHTKRILFIFNLERPNLKAVFIIWTNPQAFYSQLFLFCLLKALQFPQAENI